MITNIGPHYRLPIYKALSEKLNCDFYLGDHVTLPIKKFDYAELTNYKATLKNRFLGDFYWQSNSVRIAFKRYSTYILDGEPYCLSSWVILLLCKLLGKETIAWTHGWYGREGLVKRILKKTFYSLHTKLLIYSDYAISLMEKEGFDRSKMFCIANSMDSDYELELRKSLHPTDVYREHFGNNRPVIIYCGRIQKWKKLDMILDSVKLLKEQGKLVNVVFIGKDVENVNLDIIAEGKGILDQLWLYGPCYDDKQLSELFYNADVCVSPGNVGLTAIHALSFGCPVITHNDFAYQNPEFEAITPHVTGDFFQKDNVEDLTRKIAEWTCLKAEQKDIVRKNAYHEIDNKWNIHYQLNVLNEVIYGNK